MDRTARTKYFSITAWLFNTLGSSQANTYRQDL